MGGIRGHRERRDNGNGGRGGTAGTGCIWGFTVRGGRGSFGVLGGRFGVHPCVPSPGKNVVCMVGAGISTCECSLWRSWGGFGDARGGP